MQLSKKVGLGMTFGISKLLKTSGHFASDLFKEMERNPLKNLYFQVFHIFYMYIMSRNSRLYYKWEKILEPMNYSIFLLSNLNCVVNPLIYART